jgi:hypothetical protein
MADRIGYRFLLGATLLLLASPIVVEPVLAGGLDSGISGVVVRLGCAKAQPCRRTTPPPSFVQAARTGGSDVITVRIRNLRFHLPLRPGTYRVRLVRSATAVGTGGRIVAVRPHTYTLVVLRA